MDFDFYLVSYRGVFTKGHRKQDGFKDESKVHSGRRGSSSLYIQRRTIRVPVDSKCTTWAE